MYELINAVLEKLMLDSHIISTILYRFWTIFVGVILIVAIPICFDEIEQGYYFTFSSLIALQVFFELGLNFVVMQKVSSLMCGSKISKSNQIIDANGKLNIEVYSVIKSVKRWYRNIALLYLLALTIFGVCFLGLEVDDNKSIVYLAIWVIMVVFSSFNLYFSSFFSCLDGLGLVDQSAQIRLKGATIGYSVFILLIISDIGLASVLAISFSSAVISFYYINKFYSEIFSFNADFDVKKISWQKDIFPFQWKLGLSWISGYFIFQIINPLVFKYQGVQQAGEIGILLAIFSSLGSLSMSWVNAKVPFFSDLISQGKIKQLNESFSKLLLVSCFINVFLSSVFLAFYIAFVYLDFDIIVSRVPELKIILMMCVVSIVNHIIFSLATYMRAYGEEPMLLVSIIVALFMAPALYFSVEFSTSRMIQAYLYVNAFISLPLTLVTFARFVKLRKND